MGGCIYIISIGTHSLYTLINFFRWVLVLMESLSGSGHRFAFRKSRALSDKQELYRFDPRGMLKTSFIACVVLFNTIRQAWVKYALLIQEIDLFMC